MRILRTLVAALAVLGLTGPAMAASGPDRLGLSWDGRTWADELTGTLFNRTGSVALWVPGDTDTQHFYVRDQAGSAARLQVDYLLPQGAVVNDSDFALTASVDGAPPVALTPGAGWIVLDGKALADGQHADVAVTAVFHWGSTNQSQDERFPLQFRVRLSGIPGPLPDASGDGGQHPGHPAGGDPSGDGQASGHIGDGPLPDTGAPEVRWAMTLGLLSLGGGIGIVVLSRRRRHDAEAS